MIREYLRVTPTSANLDPNTISTSLESLHKLSDRETGRPLQRLNPFASADPLTFEFVAMSKGQDEPVEFYYGADDHLEALEQRLRSIYPASYEIDRVELDITQRLVRPVEYSREVFAERLEDGRLYQDLERSDVGRATVSDGGEVAFERDSTDSEESPEETEELSEDAESGAELEDIDLTSPHIINEDEPLTTLDGPTETPDGSIYARPPLAEVTPYGVEWWGTTARRKDWMMTLTGFTEIIGQGRQSGEEWSAHSRLPLLPLIEQLTDADHPLAFQVVFQRRSDWSRDARRRPG